jgi:glucokinase
MNEAAPTKGGPSSVGVDLGATNIRAVAFDAEVNVLGREEAPTRAQEDPESVISRIAECVRTAVERAGLKLTEIVGVGVGAAGLTDWRSGMVLLAANLGWRDVPLAEVLSRELDGARVRVEKDTIVAALAEARMGAGQSLGHFLYVTAGTGIGGGIVLNDALYRGATGGAGDIGHVVVVPNGPPCGCGDRGCVEVFASGGGIVDRSKEALIAGGLEAEASPLRAEGLTTEAVFGAAAEGDAFAAGMVQRAGEMLGLVLADYVNVNNPEAIVLGGGLRRAGDLYLEPVERELRRRSLPALGDAVNLLAPGLGEDVGTIGAALLLAEPDAEGD